MDNQGAAGREDQRLAIRGSALDFIQGYAAGGAGLVVDDHVLVERYPQLLGQQAGHHIGRAPGRKPTRILVVRSCASTWGAVTARRRRGLRTGGVSWNLLAKQNI